MRPSQVTAIVLRRLVPALVAVVLPLGCDDATGPTDGGIRVSIASTGADIDPDGYTVQLDDAPPVTAVANGELQLGRVAPGAHRLRVSGIATNCTVDGGNARDVTVARDEVAVVTFQVGCVPRVGSILVSTTTAGVEQDIDGYLVSIDGAAPVALGATGTVMVNDLREGPHVVALSGRATNCTTSVDTRTVQVAYAGVAQASFAMTCVARAGTVRVTTITTGIDQASSYTVSVDDGAPRVIGKNETLTFADVREGAHVFSLGAVPPNCTVAGSARRDVAVGIGTSTSLEFRVTCVAAVGALRVTTTTTGTATDPDGYRVDVRYDDFYYPSTVTSRAIGTNASITLPGLPIGAYYTVTLNGVAPWCTVASRSQAVTIRNGETVDVAFAVHCVPPGALRISVATSGLELDPDGYVVTASRSDGEMATGAAPSNGSVDLTNLGPGTYTVRLDGIADNCVVTGTGVRETAVSSGAMQAVAFEVRCRARGGLRLTNVTSGPDPDPDGYRVSLRLPDRTEQLSLPTGGTATRAGLPPAEYQLQVENVAENCVLVGPARRTVLVQDGAITTVPVDATCTPVTRLAFQSSNEANIDIYAVNSNGTGLVRLTTHAERDEQPAWSPDGQRIAFASGRARGGTSDIYVMNADGSGVVRRTTTGNNSWPAWSPDGRTLAFVSTRDGNAEIYRTSADTAGSPDVRLTNSPAYDADPSWSPDGRIAFTSTRDGNARIWVMQPDGSGLARLSQGAAGLAHFQPAWSPDGRSIAFTVQDCSQSYYCDTPLAVMNADGSGQRMLPSGSIGRPAWSPDGRTIAVHRYFSPDAILYVRADGSHVDLIVLAGRNATWRR